MSVTTILNTIRSKNDFINVVATRTQVRSYKKKNCWALLNEDRKIYWNSSWYTG
nr:MAG TPA: hypothetical protein [Caudoviricetes sp.]